MPAFSLLIAPAPPHGAPSKHTERSLTTLVFHKRRSDYSRLKRDLEEIQNLVVNVLYETLESQASVINLSLVGFSARYPSASELLRFL